MKKVLTVHFGKGISNAGAVRSVLEFHGIVERVPRKGYRVKFKDEEIMVPKDEIETFIKDNIQYYVQLADQLGGIKLVQESDDEEVLDSDTELSTSDLQESDDL